MNVLDKICDLCDQCDELIATATPDVDVEACRVARHKALLTIHSFMQGRIMQFHHDYNDLMEYLDQVGFLEPHDVEAN